MGSGQEGAGWGCAATTRRDLRPEIPFASFPRAPKVAPLYTAAPLARAERRQPHSPIPQDTYQRSGQVILEGGRVARLSSCSRLSLTSRERVALLLCGIVHTCSR